MKTIKKQVKKYWAPIFVSMEKFDSEEEFMKADYCFACGMLVDRFGSFKGTKKFYIESNYNLDHEHPSNIHYLCTHCYPVAKKYLQGRQYWLWFTNRKSEDLMLQREMVDMMMALSKSKKTIEKLRKNKLKEMKNKKSKSKA